MKKIFLLAGAMALLVASSCKKDNNSNGNNNGGETTRQLKKVTKTENGKTTIYNLTYDGSKLTSFSSTDNLESTAFTYDGSGNMVKLDIRGNSYYSTYTYTYNNGTPVSGTVKVIHKIPGEPDDLVQDDVLSYTVTNNQVTRIKQEMKLADMEQIANITYNSNGNVEKLTTEGDETIAVSFTYGTKKPGYPTITQWVLDAGYTMQFHAKNEVVTAFYDFPGTQLDNTITTKYTYDGKGYPLTSDDGETQLKYEYQ
ncbi:hypothetical protein A4H97_01215 [Niastella yeongjuensis]|uniref:DUF4595 domain-containing protein n=1 Tax=Niastella yeongjuensis TaxID=354355 RepID=A0A1V9EWG3_9BACT|nr:hypothetical protein [Niastella yeongjuensis]OQP50491.1 hypothetical protein A4H97_01215 [Niastella yeongjuensis]SEN32205.1 hypothetical protein SAMN05660816_00704 [Niastella yeongjuensis]